MPGQSCALFPVIDCGIYGDGDVYQSDVNASLGFTARQEAHVHYLSVRIRYTGAVIPGAVESFRILRLSFYVAEDEQFSFTHEAFVDKTELTDQLSITLHHSGSEFLSKHMQLILKPRRTKGKDV